LERLELDTEIAASAAKIKVLQMDMDEETQQDAMNDYFKASKLKTIDSMDPEVSPVRLGAVPKTPLQHTVETFGQGNLAELIITQQKLALLPAREITAFDGDPLNYHVFMRAFEHVIEDKTSSSQDRLYFLEQYTSGQPRSLVRSCLHMDARNGYVEAKRLLEEHFGDEIKRTNAYMEKALNWTAVRADDGKGLHAYALYLRGCCNAMRSLEYMEEIDMPSNFETSLQAARKMANNSL
jgi:hypothetical protein